MLDLIHRLYDRAILRHAAIAVIVAALLAALTILRPLDIAIWSLQSKLFSHAPSGEIILVKSDAEALESSLVDINRNLKRVIENSSEQGAEHIIIHSGLLRSGSKQVDKELRETLERHKDRVILSRPVRSDLDQNRLVALNSPYFEQGMKVASSDLEVDFLGFVWGIEASHSDGAAEYPSVWNVIARDGEATDAVYPDYTAEMSQIKRRAFSEIARGDPEALASVRGKTVVINIVGSDRRALKAPDSNDGDVNAILIQAVAAETAMRGGGQFVGSWKTIPAFSLMLLIGLCLFHSARGRRIFYVVWLTVLAMFFVLAATTGMRVMLAEPAFLAVVYAGIRASYNHRRRHLYTDPRSDCPNFVALRRDLQCMTDLENYAIAVVKIARIDAVLASLNQTEQGTYLKQIASRLTLGDAKMTVYHDGGKYFCFLLAKVDYPDFQAHLEGLRAVTSQAITVSGRAIDVSITIGIDDAKTGSASSRVSQAISASDQAREAYRPVFIVTDFEADSEDWDYSLQSRLEDALSNNRIRVKLQPQINLRTGQYIGAEALARWSDDVRGEISPEKFILQCERVGRLDELTKRIMRLSMEASHSLEQKGLPARVSINVSAIQLVDNRIADLIDQTLLETAANPANLVFEITESARIESFTVARNVMERIAGSGARFSIDDFGISSANLDALYCLPFSELKIDRMFANSVTSVTSARAITANLIRLSKDLDIISLAEGVETFETLEVLRNMGADLAQGFAIARPRTYSLVEETLRLQNDSALWRSG